MKIKSIAKLLHDNIYEITEAEANRLIDKKSNYDCEERQLFIVCYDDSRFMAIDNSSGECYVESFRNKDDACIWLLGLKEAEPLHAAEEKLQEWY